MENGRRCYVCMFVEKRTKGRWCRVQSVWDKILRSGIEVESDDVGLSGFCLFWTSLL